MLLLPLLVLGCTGTPDAGGETGGPADGGADGGVEGVTLGPVQPCEAPADAVTYTESAEAWGLEQSPEPDGVHGEGGSVAALDVDEDGDLDLVVAYPRSPLRLYRRGDDGFSLETLAEGPADPWLLSLADVDEDGRLDLLVGGTTPVLLRGDGSAFGPPEDLPTLAEPGSAQQVSKVLAPGDLDGDGHVDLYAVVNAGGMEPEGLALADHVLWGDGTGAFVVDEDAVPASGERRGFDAALLPWEGQRAVYVANDMGVDFGGNVLFTADGRTLVDRTSECDCGPAHSAMGFDVGDWNGDGHADLYITATPWNALLTAQGDGTFVDVAHSVGAEGIELQEELGMAWGAIFLDHDNDGQVDILDAQGDLWFPDDPNLPYLPQPIWLLRQDGGTFTEVGEDLGLAQAGSFRSTIAEDLNGDGVLDLLITEVVDRPVLYLSDGCTAAGWLAVEAPVDSRVEVTAGERTATAWTQTHSGYGGAREPRVHVGLGDAQVVDRVVITPPSGEEIVVEGPLDARRVISVEAR